MEAMGIAQPDVMDGRSLFSLRTKV